MSTRGGEYTWTLVATAADGLTTPMHVPRAERTGGAGRERLLVQRPRAFLSGRQLEELALDHVQRPGGTAVVVQVDALEGVPSDEPHVVVVVDGEAGEPPLVGMVVARGRARSRCRGRARGRCRAGLPVRGGGGWWCGMTEGSWSVTGGTASTAPAVSPPRAARAHPGGTEMCARTRRGGRAGAVGSGRATALVERQTRELAPGIVHHRTGGLHGLRRYQQNMTCQVIF